ncbi:hypothetical protein MKY95_18720 [Paenibacillus sp. FSL P4-0176]|uniref:hypothetical protein n=1 Tax=Paenibacillus sp. FSL P4-0176 TaxID=2921631 RepID=UPI0030CC17F6
MPRLIDADKLLKWIEESPEAAGFWREGGPDIDEHDAYDNLMDAINMGVFKPDQPREDT